MKFNHNKRGVKKASDTQIVLKVSCYTPIAKPLNGSLPRSNASHMLRLDSISYRYNGTGKKERKEATVTTYLLKGIKGVLRHKIAHQCWKRGLEVCHSTDKETDKHGNPLLPTGFHLLGSCIDNGECIIHQIFGSKGHEGIISVYAHPITSIPHKTAELPNNFQTVHIATEKRINLTYEGKSVQNFSERYFSGSFTYEVDLTPCSPEQIGLILEGAMHFDRLGRGYNSGYGRVEVKKLSLVKRSITKTPILDKDGSFIIQNHLTETPLEDLFQQSLEAWHHATHA